MSETKSGNFIGITLFLVGLFVGAFATFKGLPVGYLWGGFGVAILGAGIWRPKETKAGAAEFKDNVGDLIPLGRRATDVVAAKVDSKSND